MCKLLKTYILVRKYSHFMYRSLGAVCLFFPQNAQSETLQEVESQEDYVPYEDGEKNVVFLQELKKKFRSSKEQVSEQVSEPEEPKKKSKDVCVGVNWLYFQPLGDYPVYARKNYNTASPLTQVPQGCEYGSAIRASACFSSGYEDWKISAIYTHFNYKSEETKQDSFNNIFAQLLTSVYTINWNQIVNSVRGRCGLSMNVADCVFHRPFSIGKLSLDTGMGLKGAFVNQSVVVQYEYSQGDPPFNLTRGTSSYPYDPQTGSSTPQKVIGQSKFSGIGPEVTLDLHCLFPQKWMLGIHGAYSCLWGVFDLHTKYTDFFFLEGEGSLANFFKGRDVRLSSVVELQIALSKGWLYGKYQRSLIQLTAGWEMQVWSHQMRMLWLSNLNPAPAPGDLSLSGPFIRFFVCF